MPIYPKTPPNYNGPPMPWDKPPFGRPPPGGSPAPAEPEPTEPNTSLMYMSDNNKTVALAQIMGMQFALQQASMDREMQLAAKLEMGIETLDTKLQVSLLEYRQQMAAEENQHVEKMAEIKQKHVRLENGGGQAFFDLPAPDFS